MTLELDNPDLASDPAARPAVKDETVSVEFAVRADALLSDVSLNRYLPGDALITGSTGDRWCVSRRAVRREVRSPSWDTPAAGTVFTGIASATGERGSLQD
jgi:hypothetical protein